MIGKRPEIVVSDNPNLLQAAETLIAVLEDIAYIIPGLSVSSYIRGRSFAELLRAVELARQKKTTPTS